MALPEVTGWQPTTPCSGLLTLRRHACVRCLQPTQAINYLGAFYLTHLLLTTLKQTHQSRILNLTSLVEPTGTVTWDDLG